MLGGMSRQTWDPNDYRRNASFVPELGAAVLELLAPRDGEHILDLGCGDGQLTRRIAEAGAHVVGVDSSPEMVAAARALGLDAHLMSGDALSFEERFDAVFSNAALHWMKDHDAVFAGVRRALKPGGRFVGELGGFGNVAAIVTALHATLRHRALDFRAVYPWNFPTAEHFGARLAAHGFAVVSCVLIPRPTLLPSGMEAWVETFARVVLGSATDLERAELQREVRDLLEPALRTPDGTWFADYVRLRFAAARSD
jgi:SAM-dependent methyltransferase